MRIIYHPLPRGGTQQQTKPFVSRRVVVHAMGEYIRDMDGQVYFAPDWLKRCGYSAHVLVATNGDIYRCREDDEEAIHAYGNNDALSIEWLVKGIHNLTSLHRAIKKPYLTQVQLEGGIEFVREVWVKRKGILRYEGHDKVDPRQIKQDPGKGFPWDKFLPGIGVTT